MQRRYAWIVLWMMALVAILGVALAATPRLDRAVDTSEDRARQRLQLPDDE